MGAVHSTAVAVRRWEAPGSHPDANVVGMESQLIAGSRSPNGNLEAIVDQDDRAAHLYLREVGGEEGEPSPSRMRSCWIRNLKPGSDSQNEVVADMRRGLSPLMPRASCAHPQGAPPLTEARTRIVWLEEGDAVAVLEDDAILAIMPSWSGRGGFWGYARDCTSETPLAWPLLPGNALIARVRAAEECWRSWDEGDPWTPVQEGGMAAITAAFGGHEKYYAIDGGEWPPRAMLRCAHGNAVVLATCGMQLRPQPGVELQVQDPRPARRVELGFAIERWLFEQMPREVMVWLSGLSAYPWRSLTWLGHHHTMPCDAIPRGASGQAFEAVLFQRDPPGAPTVAFPSYRQDPVTVLWLTPITTAERALAEAQGSAELARRLAAAGHGWIHKDRAPVA